VERPSAKNLRRPKAYISPIGTNHVHLRNPWMTVWLSASFPGFGHIFLGSYVKGFLLVIWEVMINVNANLNTAIIYSFTGQFDLAKSVLDQRWLLLYIAVFVYSLWDAHRATISINKYSILAERNHAPIIPVKMNAVEFNYLDKRQPWLAVFWSLVMPGLGHLYLHRLPTGFFVLVWWIAITYFSRFLEALHYSFVGNFSQAVAIADPLWLLFMPSLYAFAIYDAYVTAVEYNKLFEMEQADFLKENYQNPDFDITDIAFLKGR